MFKLNPPADNIKLILQQLGDKLFYEKKKHNVRILTPNEVQNYYHSLKKINIRNNMPVEEKLDLIEHAWNTLELLMKSLMLGREFDILTDSCKRKQLDIDIMYNSKLDENGRPILSPATERNLTETILKNVTLFPKDQFSKNLNKSQKLNEFQWNLVVFLTDFNFLGAVKFHLLDLEPMFLGVTIPLWTCLTGV